MRKNLDEAFTVCAYDVLKLKKKPKITLKIKNFCKITFSPKVLKWQKCDIRTSYVTLEKLGTFPEKNHEFSNMKPRFLP